jgi:tRNA dimethylallyltransferase
MSDQLLSNHIFSIVGPTATGKSAVAFQLAEEIIQQDKAAGVVIISADSRQIYKGLEVCSGADVPPQFQRTIKFATEGFRHPEYPIFFFGTSVVSPVESWSVAHFRQYALPIMASCLSEGCLVILVGGTGLYHEHLFSTDPLLEVPPDEELRTAVALMPLDELQEKVAADAPDVWAAMNDSDKYNPRRLVRALEKQAAQAECGEALPELPFPLDLSQLSHVTVGIVDRVDRLQEKITARVYDRLQHGAVEEVQRLMGLYEDPLWKLPAFSSTGCKEVRMYVEQQLDIDQLKALWTRRELQYAKRQLTWWKAHPFATTAQFAKKTKQWTNIAEESGDWQTEISQSCILGVC